MTDFPAGQRMNGEWQETRRSARCSGVGCGVSRRRFTMRKSNSNTPRSKPSNKASAMPFAGDRPSKASAPEPGASSPPLEVRGPTTLGTLDSTPAPDVPPRRRVRFGYFKPEARAVHVAGSFNGWDTKAQPLQRDALGDWSVELDLPTGEHRYRFFVDGEWRDDPSAQQTAQNPFGGFDAIMVVV